MLFTYCAVTRQLPLKPQCLARTQGNKITWRSSLRFSNPEIQGSNDIRHVWCVRRIHWCTLFSHPAERIAALYYKLQNRQLLPKFGDSKLTMSEMSIIDNYVTRRVHRLPEIDVYKEIVHRPLIIDDAVTTKDIAHSQFKGRLNL